MWVTNTAMNINVNTHKTTQKQSTKVTSVLDKRARKSGGNGGNSRNGMVLRLC